MLIIILLSDIRLVCCSQSKGCGIESRAYAPLRTPLLTDIRSPDLQIKVKESSRQSDQIGSHLN